MDSHGTEIVGDFFIHVGASMKHGILTPQHLLLIRAMHVIGYKIIDFLKFVEDSQKRVFEKKKFIIRAEYCITMERVPEVLWDEVLQNDGQL